MKASFRGTRLSIKLKRKAIAMDKEATCANPHPYLWSCLCAHGSRLSSIQACTNGSMPLAQSIAQPITDISTPYHCAFSLHLCHVACKMQSIVVEVAIDCTITEPRPESASAIPEHKFNEILISCSSKSVREIVSGQIQISIFLKQVAKG